MVDATARGAMRPPTHHHRDALLSAQDALFRIFQLPDPPIRRAFFAGLLVENAIILLSGTYGTGKTQLVQLVKKLLFSDGQGGYAYDWESCHQELTAFDVLYHLDIAELQRGREVVHPKAMITARLKFLNEIQRANPGLFNALLPLLAERKLTYRDVEFEVPPFVCIMDRNPLDTGSSEVPEAFLDRVDFAFDIPAAHLEETMRVQELRRTADGYHWGNLEDLVQPAVKFAELAEVWKDVQRVDIPAHGLMLAGMLTDALRLCIATERSNARPDFDLKCAECQFQGEICSHLLKVPGMRVTNSLLRLAQAMAWLDGLSAVADDHLLDAFPWCLPHRVYLRPEELRSSPSVETWLREVAIKELLRDKIPSWKNALASYQQRDRDVLMEAGTNDLVIRELQALLEKG